MVRLTPVLIKLQTQRLGVKFGEIDLSSTLSKTGGCHIETLRTVGKSLMRSILQRRKSFQYEAPRATTQQGTYSSNNAATPHCFKIRPFGKIKIMLSPLAEG